MSPHISIDTLSYSNEIQKKDVVFTWDQVYYFVSTNQIKKIHRHPSVQIIYNKWIKDTLTDYGSIENQLLSTKLKFPPSASASSSSSPFVIILPNDFPYSVEKGIQHILIWSQVPLETPYVEQVLKSHYESTLWEWVYWVNPPEIQSVKALPHVHVFLRLRPTC